MKKSVTLRLSLSFLLVFSLLAPMSVLASAARGDGKKHFNEGMKHEAAELWDKAAEEFALAVADNPKNPEYRLHLTRAMFHASQMFMKRGTTAAKEGDYEGGYNAFRKAYGFDPTNELAKTEMERMVRLQKGLIEEQNNKDENGKVKLVKTGYSAVKKADDEPKDPRLEKLRDLPFPSGVDLSFIVKELARELDLNVLFDTESRLDGRKVKIDLRQVSSAKALDYIFLQENLFFQKVGPRTILVATNNRRTNFQQLVLRTFYLANASPKDVQAIIQSAIPAQPGRSQTIVLKDDATNSITVRDTAENIALISRLISSLDKDRAEVVMDVAIYEVNKNDLLQFGNQIGNVSSLSNLGGGAISLLSTGGNQGAITSGLKFPAIELTSIALGLPISSISALQSKNNTKLIASTQIHAFNNEDSSARIGQRVPVRTASFVTAANTSNNGVVSDVINYEQVGLTLKFKPIVFPNHDVQVAMEIESKDVTGAQTLQPTFTERTIKGTARVQNNKTLLLASVASNVESNGRTGLPIVGLIPIIGHLFTAPTRDNRQIDIVIAVTPRVIRAPAIVPDDEVERPTGSLATPTSGSLEGLVADEYREELVATARRVPNSTQVQLPDQKGDAPTYVRTSSNAGIPAAANTATAQPVTDQIFPKVAPIDTSVRTLQIGQTSDTSVSTNLAPISSDVVGRPTVQVTLPATTEMKKGQTVTIPVEVKASTGFMQATFGLKFDPTKVAVRNVTFGDVFGSVAGQAVNPFANAGGQYNVTLSLTNGQVALPEGVLAYVELEALADGIPQISLDRDLVVLRSAQGTNFQLR